MSQILLEKDKQIECLKSIITLKEQQNQTQKSLIESLQRQLQTEKKMTQLLSNQKTLLQQKIRPLPPDKRAIKKEGGEEEEVENKEKFKQEKTNEKGEIENGGGKDGNVIKDKEEGRRKKEEGGKEEEGRGRGISMRAIFDDLPKITEMDESPMQTENNEVELEDDYIAEIGGNKKRAQSVNKPPIDLAQKQGMLERAKTERMRIDEIFNSLDEGEKDGEKNNINIEPEKEQENFSLSFAENATDSPRWMSKKLERRCKFSYINYFLLSF